MLALHVSLISSIIYGKERKEEEKEGRMERRKNGRKKGRMEEWKDGRKKEKQRVGYFH